MISLEALVMALLYLIIAGVVWYLLYWLIGFVGLPDPFRKVAIVILAVAAVFVCIAVLMGIAGHPLVRW